jgi:hypothetical protein
MSIKQAAAQARKYAHGCLLHGEAMTVLFAGYRKAKGWGDTDREFITLDALWGWVNGYLEMEEAAQGPTPLG